VAEEMERTGMTLPLLIHKQGPHSTED
jgi:hypothetical protein